MTTRILHRKTSVKDRAPIASDTASNGLLPGELGINFNEESPTLYIRDSADNIVAFQPGGSASVSVGDTAPLNPTLGDLWWNEEDGVLYIYYTDIDSSQWVPASPQGGGGDSGGGEGRIQSFVSATAPGAPVEADLWYNLNDGAQYAAIKNAGGNLIWAQII